MDNEDLKKLDKVIERSLSELGVFVKEAEPIDFSAMFRQRRPPSKAKRNRGHGRPPTSKSESIRQPPTEAPEVVKPSANQERNLSQMPQQSRQQAQESNDLFGLSGNALIRFREIATQEPELLSDAVERLGWERTLESRERKKLEKRGLVVYRSIGNKRKLPILSEQGKELATKLGWSVPKHKGGPEHHWIQGMVIQMFKGMKEKRDGADGGRVKVFLKGIEGVLNGVQADILFLIEKEKKEEGDWDVDGDQEQANDTGEVSVLRVGVQICVKNSARYEATRLAQLGSLPDLHRAALVAATKKKRESIQRIIKKSKESESTEKVMLLDIEDMLGHNFIIGDVLGLK